LLGYNQALGYASREAKASKRYQPVHPAVMASLPPHVDWREKNVITAVKDQGMLFLLLIPTRSLQSIACALLHCLAYKGECGSCWTFGTAETIESHFAIATGKEAQQHNILSTHILATPQLHSILSY
jgi:C1A family cysteine protease